MALLCDAKVRRKCPGLANQLQEETFSKETLQIFLDFLGGGAKLMFRYLVEGVKVFLCVVNFTPGVIFYTIVLQRAPLGSTPCMLTKPESGHSFMCFPIRL